MSSGPIYSLRFAAHCRSRLRFIGGAHTQLPDAAHIAHADAQRVWLRLAAHPGHVRAAGRCATDFARVWS